MNNSATVAIPTNANNGSPVTTSPESSNQEGRTARNQRSSGKGRRRRAAAEQRRIDQQRWGHYMQESDEEEIAAATRFLNRRRPRRSSRYNVRDDWLDDFSTFETFNEDLSLDVALALSLSISENVGDSQSQSSIRHETLDMSYENLVLLENVKCVASSVVVSSLTGFVFEEKPHICSSNQKEESTDNPSLSQKEICSICQTEYENGDHIMMLPCTHNFHHACGSEWLLNYSKFCPVCKHDITEQGSACT